MSQEPYKIVDTKTAWYSKLGSVAVAVGSVATAVVLTVPGMPGSATLNQNLSTAAQKTQGSEQASTSTGSAPSSSAAVGNPAQVDQLLTTGQNVGQTAANPNQVASLVLGGITTGNTSSPTPYSASNGSGSNTSGNGIGNTSSPTPAGGAYDDDEEEYEEDDRDEEEEDEDDEDDD